MIKPTVGRVVHYWPSFHDQERGMSFTDKQPLAAHISCVWSDTCVNLMVIDGNGNTHSRTTVMLHQDGMLRPTTQFAEWMPYQKAVVKGEIAPTLHVEPKS